MRIVSVFCMVFSAATWAADREVTLREAEKRSFKLPGVSQVAIDDAAVVEAVGKNDQLTLTARGPGNARVLVLLKNDQWLTFRVRVVGSTFPEGPVPEALPDEGEVIRLKVGEVRAFDTGGIQKLPPPGASGVEVKVNGKVLELKGVSPGRVLLEPTLSSGKRMQLSVSVAGEHRLLTARPQDTARAEHLQVPVSGEVLIKAADVEAVGVEDDEVAEVRIVGDGRVVVRGLQEGDTVVTVRRAGRLYSHSVNVTPRGEQ